MKERENKEIIIGLVVLIALCILAILLILRREDRNDVTKEPVAVKEHFQKDVISDKPISDEIKENADGNNDDAGNVSDEIKNLAIIDEEPVKEVQKAQSEIPKGEIISNRIAGSGNEFHTEPKYKEYTGEELWQLEEIYYYWAEYKLDAVDDLIHLPRVRTITNELKGSNDFYYYGEKDQKGKPSGTGLAVYADNAYYFGEWEDGKRHGKGMWWKIFPDKTGIVNGVTGVLEHSYNGSWANDYPNGEGQEHFGYDLSIAEGECMITNVIGNFKDGYYDGELYIMTADEKEGSIDWEGKATRGVFEYCSETYSASGRRQIWKRMKEVEDNNINFHWVFPNDNKSFGIYGLKRNE